MVLTESLSVVSSLPMCAAWSKITFASNTLTVVCSISVLVGGRWVGTMAHPPPMQGKSSKSASVRTAANVGMHILTDATAKVGSASVFVFWFMRSIAVAALLALVGCTIAAAYVDLNLESRWLASWFRLKPAFRLEGLMLSLLPWTHPERLGDSAPEKLNKFLHFGRK